MTPLDLRVVDLSGNIPGMRLGIAHITVVCDSFATNLDAVRKTAFIASERNIKAVILPYHMPYGPIINFIDNEKSLNAKAKLHSYSMSKKHPYIRALKHIATNYDISIISPGLIEKSGPRYYIAVFFSKNEPGNVITSRRKVVLSDFERKLGIMPGKAVETFIDKYAKYFVLLNEEIYVPELVRIASLEKADVVITSTPVSRNLDTFFTLLRALAMISGIWIVNSGGIFIDAKTNEMINVPSIIINPEGKIIGQYNDSAPALITMSYRAFKNNESKTRSEGIKHVINTYINILRRRLRK